MIRFGTGGWRAIIADEFTKENIRLLVAGLCALMRKEGHEGTTICLGYDRRFLSKESMHWAAEVLAGCGFRPYIINRSVPTPLIMFTVKQMGLPYGMAVTASHNPAIYNGIKVFTAGGRDADKTVTRKIEEEIAKLRPEDVKIFTIKPQNELNSDSDKVGLAMKVLEEVVEASLRKGDVGTRYSSCQYIVILMGTDTKDGVIVTNRIMENFNKNCDVDGVKIYFDINDIELSGESKEGDLNNV